MAMTNQPLRELAVTVREHGSGSFYWILIERSPAGNWQEIAVSEHYQTSWADAFDAGIVQLHTQVPDEQVGPREGT
jgi:hypothetical protein